MNNPRRLQDAYSGLWEKAANDCKQLAKILEHIFPDLTIKPGYGAFSSEKLDDYDFKKHERGAADLFLYDATDKIICAIEVTGSDRINMYSGRNIWIRPDKVTYMRKMKAEFPVFGFFVYRNCQRVLNLPIIEKYESDRIVSNPRGPEFAETYIEIPYSDSLDPGWLYAYISMHLQKVPRIAHIQIDVLTTQGFELLPYVPPSRIISR